MATGDIAYLTPEAEARVEIDRMFAAAGWIVQDYARVEGLPDELPTAVEGAPPFAYQSTGVEMRFTNTLGPDAKSRQVFWFHRPETLASWITGTSARTRSNRRCATGCAGCRRSRATASGRHKSARSAASRSRSR